MKNTTSENIAIEYLMDAIKEQPTVAIKELVNGKKELFHEVAETSETIQHLISLADKCPSIPLSELESGPIFAYKKSGCETVTGKEALDIKLFTMLLTRGKKEK